MDAQPKKLSYFKDDKIKVIVPFFQRPYVWDEKDWSGLVSSIEKSSPSTMPFLGSFILKLKETIHETSGEKINEYWVIDGQQRITTLNILIKCFLENSRGLVDNSDSVSLLNAIYSMKREPNGDKKYILRITPSHADEKMFELVMSDDEEEKSKLIEGKDRISDCYLFFRRYLKSLSDDGIKLLTNKLLTDINFFISITLNEDDDEQEIFDSVNSLGKELSNTDIVKNHLYQRMRDLCGDSKGMKDEVIKHYKKYWEDVFLTEPMKSFWDESKTLGRITITKLDNFLKCFGTIKGIYVPSESGGVEKIAERYKDHLKNYSYEQLVEFSKELSSYGQTYYEMWKNYNEWDGMVISDRLNSTIFVLETIGTSTFDPYILKLIQTKDPEINEKLFALQRFVLKRFLWKASTKNYNKCCLQLLASDNPNEYLDKYNSESIDTDWTKYPQQIRNLSNKQGTLLTCLIEMILRKDDEGMYDNYVVFNEKTLEHIMPRQWKKNWSDVPSFRPTNDGKYILLEDEDEIRQFRNSMIPSLGNMTLLRNHLNTSIGNKDIKTKVFGDENKKNEKCVKTFAGGYRITLDLIEQLEGNLSWDERNIVEREFALINILNDYYDFVDVIEQTFEEELKFDVSKIDKDYFDDDYFKNTRIQTIAWETFQYLLYYNLLTDDEIKLLKDKKYTSTTLGVWLPMLVTGEEDLDNKDYFKRRYYRKPIVDGLYLCRQLYEDRRDCRNKIISWVRPKIERDKN